jgi:hypothetical protein
MEISWNSNNKIYCKTHQNKYKNLKNNKNKMHHSKTNLTWLKLSNIFNNKNLIFCKI